MPLDDLIPIGGAARSNTGSKRGGSSDLTSGLISISGARDNVDVDMTDFDVGDLLGDDSGKAKSKSKDKSDDKKKKKSKDKDKDKSKSSSSSKKKSKSKSKKSAFDDDDDFGDDGGAKNWDSAAELEMAAAAAARRKNGSGTTGGGLDDEFAKMLGLDSGDVGSGANFGSAESPPLSPEPVTRGADKVDDDTFGISGYTPTVRGSKKSDVPAPVEEHSKAENKGISASFFQDDGKRDEDVSSLSSFLGPSTDRRGGSRGGRRQTGGADSDPFGFGSTAAPSSSTFDSLFGGSSSRRSYLDDPFAKPPKDSLESTQQDLKDPTEERKADQTRSNPHQDNFPARSSPPTQRVSAKDDLLADLFSSEPRSSVRSDRRQEQSSFSKRDEVDGDDDDRKTKVEKSPEPTTPTVLPVAADPAKQQNDLLAELFATQSSSKTTAYEKPKYEDEAPKAKPAVVETNPTTPPKETISLQEKAEARTASALPSENSNADLASARDSLLMDLLGGLSPPKPSEPLLSRRRSRNTSNNNSPDKEVGKAPDPFKSSSPTQSQPLPTVPKVPAATPVAVVAASERPVTPPSPGRRRSLTMDKGSLDIRESDFEQSKDSLLEEILPSSPSVSARSSPHRRNSYSQSFEVEESAVADDVAEKQGDEVVEEQETQVAADPPVPVVAPIVKSSPPPQAEPTVKPEVRVPTPPPQPIKSTDHHEPQVILAVACNCVEREAKLTAAFDVERAALQQKINELMQQLEAQAASSNQLTQQLTQQLEKREASIAQLSQQLEARGAANAQLAQQLASAERDKLEAHQAAAASKEDAASFQHRAELLEAEVRSLREELSRSKRAVQDAELALAREIAQHDEVDQLERHREKRALEALSAQMQRALARLTISHQVQEEGSGYDNSAARVAAEDEARLRVIASLEGSSKRAAQHAEQERTKLAELLRELEAGARNARQGALEDKERLRQEQQRLDALSAHLQAQAAALRDQEAAHAGYMGKQLAEAREDARVYEARLATRRTQLERDERALYEARAEFAAFREQTALEIEREHEELRRSRLKLEDAWRELRADREDLEAELASHEDEFQALESVRQEVQQAEARLAERTQDVVALAEKLDAGTRELLAREQLVAQQAAVVQDTDTSFSNRERALERVKHELETREQRLHVQIRQLDSVRMRLTQQRREQQQLMAAARRNCTTEKPTKVVVDNNKPWRQASIAPHSSKSSYSPLPQSWEMEQPIEEEDPSGLPPALRKQVEANWLRRNQQVGHYRQSSSCKLDFHDFAAEPSKWSSKTLDLNTTSYINKSSKVNSAAKLNNVRTSVPVSHHSVDSFKAQQQQRSNSPATGSRPPPPPMRSPGTFQPTLRVNL
ncbi:hypothetical protein PR001_g13992 [Phytophthora rubi]|uniref:Uncharacterized protein n=1 Tax=Phytophthora rubi TaxID=129364 RepID=A0A6A3L6X3_9STRA|nr:hypothetical protein PR002_g14427 [Phytophthora rubi]KAE9018987.1 hypothetical protein PR001_g13992 [Phytophthora rubi]